MDLPGRNANRKFKRTVRWLPGSVVESLWRSGCGGKVADGCLYLFHHNVYGDVEIWYSWEILAKYARSKRKVKVFGDRPVFRSKETSLIEHVPRSYVTRCGSRVARRGWERFVGAVDAERSSQRHRAAGEMGS